MSGENSPVFIDTNILVYAYDRSAGEKHQRAVSLLEDLWQSERGVLSIQVLQEFYVVVTRKIPQPVAQETAAAIVRDLGYLRIHVPVVEDVLGAIVLQQRFQTSFWDAMILWSALQLHCSQVWSEDLSAGQGYDGIQVVNPFEF